MLKNSDIIIFSGIDWDMQWQWQQELAIRLSKNNRVLFIENTGVRSMRLKDTGRVINRVKNFFKSSYGFRQVNSSLAVYSPIFLPFPYVKIVSWLNSLIINSFLNSWFMNTKFNCKQIFTFISTPLTIDLIDKIPHDNKVFLYTDNMPKASSSANELKKYVKHLASISDFCFYSAENLKKQLTKNKKLFYFPGGVDLQKFNYQKFTNVKKENTIGYVGQIKSIIDQDLIIKIAKSFPKFNIELIGPIATNIDKFKNIKNIKIVGSVKHKNIPKYISKFRVAIIPYIKNDYTNSISPAKLNEYLAMGVPCVSTNLNEINYFNKKNKKLIYLSNNEKDFVRHISNILKMNKNHLKKLKTKSINQASLYNWNILFNRFNEICENNFLLPKIKILSNWRQGFELGYNQLKGILVKFSFIFILFYFLIFLTPLISFLGTKLSFYDENIDSKNLLISSGSGSTYLLNTEFQLRYKEALNLYSSKNINKIIIMRRQHNGIEEGELIRKLLISSGVNKDNIQVVDKEFKNSFENYRYVSSKYFNKDKNLILVVAPHHSLRAKLLFDKNSHLDVMISRSLDYKKYDYLRVNLTLKEIKTILREYVAIIHNFTLGRL